MTPQVVAMPGNEGFAGQLAVHLEAKRVEIVTRHFPDGESYVRLLGEVNEGDVIVVCTLDRPDDKVLRLLFAADAARDLGAKRVGLVAPYLAYMRQDRRFQPGEAVTSTTLARLISGSFDWMVTVDPHLHRRSSMSEIYSIQVGVGHAASALSVWIKTHVSNPIVIGPDAESEQWVSAVAAEAGAPFTVLEKERRGDRDVVITVRGMERWLDRQPVLVDDIISSGRTMEVAIGQLIARGCCAPVIVGVHGVFAEDAHQRLLAAGAAQIVSTNSISHPTNGIDLVELVAGSVRTTLQCLPCVRRS